MQKPPKRRAPAAQPAKEKAPRQSALAKEHGITAATEAEIKESFALFSTSKDSLPSNSLRRALTALNIQTTPSQYKELLSVADPEDEGIVSYGNFVAIAALKLNARGQEEESQEVREGFELFLKMGGCGGKGDEGKITMGMLKRVSALLKEDVSDDVLRDMVLEANGGSGVGKGVDLDGFEAVMRRGEYTPHAASLLLILCAFEAGVFR